MGLELPVPQRVERVDKGAPVPTHVDHPLAHCRGPHRDDETLVDELVTIAGVLAPLDQQARRARMQRVGAGPVVQPAQLRTSKAGHPSSVGEHTFENWC